MSQKNSSVTPAMYQTPNEFDTMDPPQQPTYTEPEGFFEKLFCGLFTDCAS